MNPFSALGAKIFGGVSVALAIALAAQTVHVAYWGHGSDGWEATGGKWETAQQAQEAAYVAAQVSAAAAAHSARLAAEQQSRTIAERAVHEDLSVASAAAARFADTRRLRGDAAPAASSPSTPRPQDKLTLPQMVRNPVLMPWCSPSPSSSSSSTIRSTSNACGAGAKI